MTTLDLVLHLPLDRLDDPAAMDRAPQRRPVGIAGAPRAGVDSVVGAATHLAGSDGLQVTLGGLGTGSPDFTLSVWLRVDAFPAAGGFVLALGGAGDGAHRWTLDPGGLGRFGTASQAVTVPVPLQGWRHWAVTQAAGSLALHLDGTPVAAPVAVAHRLADSVLRIGLPPPGAAVAGLVGAIANLRVHARALAPDEIAAMVADDRPPRVALQAENPLDCRLLDANDKPAIYIEEGPGGEDLTLEVINVSTRPLEIGGAGRGRAAIDLTFRPDTLALRDAATLRESDRWAIRGPLRNADGTVTLSLWSRVGGQRVEPGAALTLTLPGIAAAAGDGARVSRVEFAYRGFAFADGSRQAVAGSRVKTLSIVSHAGRPNPPLAFTFRNQGSLLPGAAIDTNRLELSVVNTSASRPLRFDAATDGHKGSDLVLAVEARHDGEQRPTALCRVTDIAAIAVTAPPGWTAHLEGEDSVAPCWVLTPDATVELQPGARLDIDLDRIVTSNPPGRVPLRLIHRRMPGFWDGEQRLEVDKSPLQFDDHGKVGIGTATPGKPLAIRADAGGEWLGFHAADGAMVWHANNLGAGFNIAESDVRDGRFFLAAGGYGAAIGTTAPAPGTDLHLTRPAAQAGGGTTLLIEAQAGATAPPRLRMTAPGADIALGPGGAKGADGILSSATGGVQILSNRWGKLGVDAFGAWAGDPEGKRPTGGYHIPLTVYGSITVTDYAIARGLLMGRQNSRTLQFDYGVSVEAWENSNRQVNIEPRELAGKEFLHLQASTAGVLSVLDGGEAPYAQLYWNTAGVVIAHDLRVKGKVSAQTKQFVIDHPQRPGARLVHASLEGPENGVSYRGEAQLSGGTAVITLPPYFEALTRPEGRTVHLTAKGRTPFLLSYDDVEGGQFRVHGTAPEGWFSWELRAVRADVPPLVAEPEADGGGDR